MTKKKIRFTKSPSKIHKIIKFSIVIPTKNRALSVTRLVSQLLSQKYPSAALEIIVVDNGSVDQTVQLLRSHKSPRLRVVTELIAGPSQCRNTGFALTKFDHVIFLDDDIEVKSNFLTQCGLAWKRHENATAIGAQILPKFEKGQLTPKASSLLDRYKLFFAFQDYGNKSKQVRLSSFLISATLSINKTMLRPSVALFNTALGRPYLNWYIYGEDFELCRRLILDKHEVWYVPSIRVLHNIATSRFSNKYIATRHLLCGVDCFFEDLYLVKRYPRYIYFSKGYLFLSALKQLLFRRRSLYMRRFGDPMERIQLLSYFLLGPLFFIYSLLESVFKFLYKKLLT